MGSRAVFRGVGCALLLAFGAGCGGTNAPEAEESGCSQTSECRPDEVCETGACVKALPPKLTTESLSDAIVGERYEQSLTVDGGKAPLTWIISERAPALRWISIDPTTGTLSGTPSAATPSPAALQVTVSDAGGREAARSFSLRVHPCKEGETVSCFAALSTGGCGMGAALCINGGIGTCEELQPSTDPARCNESCGPCDLATANACTNGSCACGEGEACGGGTACCGAAGGSGCVDISSDANNCGACGNACSAPPNGVATCTAGVCSYICEQPFDSCDPTQPCGTNLDTSSQNCGACGAACTGAGVDGCVDGACVCGSGPRCASGDTCCGASGSEPARCADLQGGTIDGAAVKDCGACGNDCQAPQGPGPGEALCNAGQCGAVCLTDSNGHQWADCQAGTGTPTQCNVNLSEDEANCGTCGNACPGDPTGNGVAVCSNGSCGLMCSQGFAQCNGPSCKDLSSDSTCGANCQACSIPQPLSLHHLTGGGCCKAWETRDNSCDVPCTQGAGAEACECRFLCEAGWADCDLDAQAATASNGCEVRLANGESDGQGGFQHCGACNNTCPNYASTTPHCNAGTCEWSCDTLTADCDGNIANGCETPLNTLADCKTCGTPCPPPGAVNVASASCSNGSCSIACEPGWSDCDRNIANGCETNLNTLSNCGECGKVCDACNNGVCGESCGGQICYEPKACDMCPNPAKPWQEVVCCI